MKRSVKACVYWLVVGPLVPIAVFALVFEALRDLLTDLVVEPISDWRER